MERVDDQLIFRQPHLAEEMAGKSDPLDREPAAAPDLHVDDAQGERDSHATLEHFVQEAVAGVVVVRLVAAEAELVEEVGVHAANPALGNRPGGQTRLDTLGESVEQAQVAALVEVGILLPRYRQSGPDQVDRLLRDEPSQERA